MKIRIFLMILLLSVTKAAYYEGLREFYNRIDHDKTLKPLQVKEDDINANSDGHCVTVVPGDISDRAIYVNTKACKDTAGAECFVSPVYNEIANPDMIGICLQKTYFYESTKGFPGDACQSDSDCLFGPRRCGSNGACQGVSKYGACRQSADCVTKHFCSYGHCIPILTQGSSCSSSEDCGREAVCLFTDPSSIFGTCTNVLSLEVGSTVFYKDADDKIVYVEGGEKACRSAWVDKQEGRCSDGVQSKRKGQICGLDEENPDDRNCTTSRTDYNASCLAGYNGKLMCDVDGGDDEWLEARDAFSEYMVASKVCHNAARWSECGAPAEYKKWRCAETKALHYVKLIENSQTLRDSYSSFPDLREYNEFCGGLWLKISWSIILILLITLI